MAQTRLSDPVTRRLSNRIGIDEEALHEMTLARYAGNALPHLPVAPWTDGTALKQWRSSAWFSDRRARWCTQCLNANDRRWPLRWMLPWTFVCVEHREFLATECIRCLSPVHYGRHFALTRCQSQVARRDGSGHAEVCDFMVCFRRSLPVTDESILVCQERVNRWLDGIPSAEDRSFVSLTAVLVPLVTPIMMRRRGQDDPAVLARLRTAVPSGRLQRVALDPLRVAAAATVAERLMQRHDTSAASLADYISGLRSVDWQPQYQLDVMTWAYGPALRPNVYVDELVRRGTLTIGSFERC